MFKIKKDWKNKIIVGAVNILQEIDEEKTIQDIIKSSIAKEFRKQEDLEFLLKSFNGRFGIDVKTEIAPVIEEGSFNINKWQFKLNKEILFEENGFDKLSSKITEAILTQDKKKVNSIINNIEKCLQA